VSPPHRRRGLIQVNGQPADRPILNPCCAVFGMPRAAIASGAVHAVLPLAEIARELKRLAKIPELTEA
jgi:CheB methylesterase